MLQSKKRSWKTLLISLVAVLSITIMAGCGNTNDSKSAGKGTDTSKVIATYEGGEITEDEFDFEQKMMLLFQPAYQQMLQMDEFREYLVKQSIGYEYLVSKADEKAKEAGKKSAETQMAEMKKQSGEDQFKTILDSQGIEESEFLNYLTRMYTVIESQKTSITDDEVKKEFEANKEEYITASVRHILIGFTDPEGKERKQEDALKIANEIKAELDKGADFATLAKEKTEDPGSKEDGGLYENYPASSWVPEFKEKTISLPLNTISEPIKTDYGYHIMRVESRSDSLDALAENIKQGLAAKKMDEFMTGELEKNIIKKIDLPTVQEPEQSTEGTNSGSGNTTNGDSTDSTQDSTTDSNTDSTNSSSETNGK